MRIKEAIIVEGVYDKTKLAGVVDATVVTTDGFDIIHNKEKLAYVKELAKTQGIVIFTDSDKAGFRIRNYLKGQITEGRVLHAYIPDVFGKERRKRKASKEGLLGVEGLGADVILNALTAAGCNRESLTEKRLIKRLDLYEDGFIGGFNSSEKRKKLTEMLGLPKRLSTNALLDALNSLISFEKYKELFDE